MTEENREPEILCELRHVDKEFDQAGGSPLRVLQDIDLAVRTNEVVALLGPSGCGKSTILRILAGLTTPTRGEVLDHGKPLDGLNPGIGFVFQSFALFPWMTVSRNVEAMLEARGLPKGEVTERAARAIQVVGLAGFEEAYPRELSGGMKQRVGMARAFSLEPEMLFMDEPFSQVDVLTAESLRAEVLDVWAPKDRNPKSIVMVSHDIKEVVYMADRIVVLDANPGRVRTIVENTLPRPRDYRAPGLLQLVDRLHDIITGMEMPDVAEAQGAERTYEPLPHAGGGEIEGLLEYLDARGGRKAIFREKLLDLLLFDNVRLALGRAEGNRVDRDYLLELIALNLPSENFEATFETLVNWARFGDLFSYDETNEILDLSEEVPVLG